MPMLSGLPSITPTCSLMTPTIPPTIPNRAAIHTPRGHTTMPNGQNQPTTPPLWSGLTVTNPPTTPEAMDAMLVSLIQQFAMQLAAWRGSKLTGIKLDMEPLQ
ncbi:MAG: hypothetical protein KDJ70_17375 [Candidatus Competibacteraceae bacterium]|nr:hypothetical protein [Candidatus Competibacteraceae bacterium]